MGSHVGGRSVEGRYSYFMRGRQLMIVEHKETDNTTDAGDDSPTYQAPSEAITAGLMLEYTSVPDVTEMVDESDDVPLNDVLALALIDYIKASVTLDPGLRDYHMHKFNQRVVRYVEGRTGGLRRALGNKFMR